MPQLYPPFRNITRKFYYEQEIKKEEEIIKQYELGAQKEVGQETSWV